MTKIIQSMLLFIMLCSPVAHAIEQGEPAPDFTATTLEGETLQLRSLLKQGPVYLVFFSTWCELCQFEISAFKRIHHHFGDRLPLIAINSDVGDDHQQVERYVEAYQLPYRVIYDGSGALRKTYEIHTVPQQLLISPSGKVVYLDSDAPAGSGMKVEAVIEARWRKLFGKVNMEY